MTTAALDSLTLYQWGKETTPGTLVAATSKIVTPRMTFTEEGNVQRPQYAKGLVVRNRGNEFVTNRHTVWTVPEMPVNFEQLQNWLSMAFGTVAPTGSNPYTYAFVRNLTAKTAPLTWTFERRIRDGTNNFDLEWGYAFATRIRFSGAQNAPVMMSVEGVARRTQTSTLTAAQSLPSDIESPIFVNSQAYIDSTWAGLGGTAMTGLLIGWEVDIQTGYYPIFLADARTDLDFSRWELDANRVTIAARLRFLSDIGGQWAVERTAAQAQSLRAVRIQATGSGSRSLQINFLAKHTNSDLIGVEVAEDRNEINVELEETTDDTNLMSVTLVNTKAAIG